MAKVITGEFAQSGKTLPLSTQPGDTATRITIGKGGAYYARTSDVKALTPGSHVKAVCSGAVVNDDGGIIPLLENRAV